MTITLEKPRGSRDWLRIYGLYLAAFPASERKPFSVIRKMHARGRTDVWRVLKDNKFAGFAATVNGGDRILLDYLAVRKSCRGFGIGSAAMAALLDIYCDKGFFVEIESTREDAPDLEARLRRRHFYLDAGLEDLGVSASVFGVNMDLLGTRCTMNFEDYRGFYQTYYSPWAAKHLEPMK